MTTEQLLVAGIGGVVAALGAVVAGMRVLWRAYQEQAKILVSISERSTETMTALKGAIDVLAAKLNK